MGLQKYNYFLFVQIYSQGNVGKRQAGEGTRGQGTNGISGTGDKRWMNSSA